MQNLISKVKVKKNDNLGLHSEKIKKEICFFKRKQMLISLKRLIHWRTKRVFYVFLCLYKHPSAMHSYKSFVS